MAAPASASEIGLVRVSLDNPECDERNWNLHPAFKALNSKVNALAWEVFIGVKSGGSRLVLQGEGLFPDVIHASQLGDRITEFAPKTVSKDLNAAWDACHQGEGFIDVSSFLEVGLSKISHLLTTYLPGTKYKYCSTSLKKLPINRGVRKSENSELLQQISTTPANKLSFCNFVHLLDVFGVNMALSVPDISRPEKRTRRGDSDFDKEALDPDAALFCPPYRGYFPSTDEAGRGGGTEGVLDLWRREIDSFIFTERDQDNQEEMWRIQEEMWRIEPLPVIPGQPPPFTPEAAEFEHSGTLAEVQSRESALNSSVPESVLEEVPLAASTPETAELRQSMHSERGVLFAGWEQVRNFLNINKFGLREGNDVYDLFYNNLREELLGEGCFEFCFKKEYYSEDYTQLTKPVLDGLNRVVSIKYQDKQSFDTALWKLVFAIPPGRPSVIETIGSNEETINIREFRKHRSILISYFRKKKGRSTQGVCISQFFNLINCLEIGFRFNPWRSRKENIPASSSSSSSASSSSSSSSSSAASASGMPPRGRNLEGLTALHPDEVRERARDVSLEAVKAGESRLIWRQKRAEERKSARPPTIEESSSGIFLSEVASNSWLGQWVIPEGEVFFKGREGVRKFTDAKGLSLLGTNQVYDLVGRGLRERKLGRGWFEFRLQGEEYSETYVGLIKPVLEGLERISFMRYENQQDFNKALYQVLNYAFDSKSLGPEEASKLQKFTTARDLLFRNIKALEGIYSFRIGQVFELIEFLGIGFRFHLEEQGMQHSSASSSYSSSSSSSSAVSALKTPVVGGSSELEKRKDAVTRLINAFAANPKSTVHGLLNMLREQRIGVSFVQKDPSLSCEVECKVEVVPDRVLSPDFIGAMDEAFCSFIEKDEDTSDKIRCILIDTMFSIAGYLESKAKIPERDKKEDMEAQKAREIADQEGRRLACCASARALKDISYSDFLFLLKKMGLAGQWELL